MKTRLFYLKLELKRAAKRLPLMAAGAAVLMFFMGAAVLLAARTLYGGQAVGRIAIGVALPEDDALARQVTSMLGSLESVKSICDFSYMDRESCLKGLKTGELFAAVLIPDGFVQSIMDGGNIPVPILLPEDADTESLVFKELANAGALTLSAAQAGIYAGSELLERFRLSEARSQLEQDLNRLYLEYSLPRNDFFRKASVSAAGDVPLEIFYGISLFVLFLSLAAIPVSGGLLSPERPLCQKLSLLGISPATRVGARILGLAVLYAAITAAAAAAACFTGVMDVHPLLPAVLVLFSVSLAALTVFFFQAAGSLMGGVLFLFLGTAVMHFFSGGIRPLVFLPPAIRAAAPFLPSHIFMEAVQMAVTSRWELLVFGKLFLVAAAGFFASLAFEVKRA